MAESAYPTTHVFADIEGSTRLWEAQPERMADALARHDEMTVRVVSAAGGRVVKHTGDGWHAVFDDPAQAVCAVLDYQRSLADVSASAGIAIACRCGIHTGISQARDGDFFGSSINRSARIMSAAHGGQVLVSNAAADLLAGRLPSDCSLRDLGRVRLRDLADADHVYQLVHPSLRDAFPPLRGLLATPNNLPLLTSSFVGRTGSLAELVELTGAHRLVTITGPGGIGKTRIALHLATGALERFEDGVWIAPLASIDSSALVPAAVAQVLSVREDANRDLVESLASYVSARRLLLVLDNCEHVLPGCAALAETILQRAPNSRVVATSREPLHVEGELVYPLSPLALPDLAGAATAAAVATFPSVRLFVDRMREQLPTFALTDRNAATITRICRTLDGLPLAIELAAARARSMAPDEIARRLADRFALLTQGRRTAVARHRTLEAMIGWSYELLDDRERTLFDRLAVFAGGFDLEAAEAIAGAPPLSVRDVAEVLGRLVDKSLVAAEFDDAHDAVRYRLLESMREFAMRALAARAGAHDVKLRHADHYQTLLAMLPAESDGAGRRTHLVRLDLERDNLRAAVSFRLGQAGDADGVLSIVHAYSEYCQLRGMFAQAASALSEAMALPIAAAPSLLRARLAHQAGFIAMLQIRLREAARLGEQALADYRLFGQPDDIASCLDRLAGIASIEEHLDDAIALHREALAILRDSGNVVRESKVLVNLATSCMQAGRFEEGRQAALRGSQLARATGQVRVEAYAELTLGGIAIEEDRACEAEPHYERILILATSLADRMLETFGRAGLAQVDLACGRISLAHGKLLEALDFFVLADMRREVTMVLDDLAFAHACRDAASAAGRLFAAAARERAQLGIALTGSERVRTESRIAAIRQRDAAAFADGWSQGSVDSFEAAIEAARRTELPAERPDALPASEPRSR